MSAGNEVDLGCGSGGEANEGLVCLIPPVDRRRVVLAAFAEGSGAKLLPIEKWQGEGTPVVMGFLHGAADIIRFCRQKKKDFWFIDHAYWNRGYEAGNFRVVKNGIHKTWLSGSGRPIPQMRDWFQGEEILVIPPSGTIAYTYGAQDWLAETAERLRGSRFVVKQKNEGELSWYLPRAKFMVSYASVAEVEALYKGVVVITEQGPGKPISGIRGDRKSWAESLACGQFLVEEMRSGKAWEILNGD